MKVAENMAIRWHSRAGQGAVSAGQFFSEAMISLGKHSMCFPSFGAEKRGAPVEVFNRIAEHELDDPSQPRILDLTILLEPSLVGEEMTHEEILSGLKKDGILLINTSKKNKSNFHQKFGGQIYHVPATRIAFDTVGRNVPNVATIGALTKILNLDKEQIRLFLEKNLSAVFPEKIVSKNLTGFDLGYDQVIEITGSTGGSTPKRNPSEGDSWQNLPQAALAQGGTSKNYHPGTWNSTQKLLFVPENCIQCGICWAVCPDDAIVHDPETGLMIGIDQEACKRCGLCVRACSANKMAKEDPNKFSLVMEDVPEEDQAHF